jgi:integrase/recombinase XerD
MLSIYRRHKRSCPHRNEGRSYRRCQCPIWVDGFLGKQDLRQSLRLRDWTKAQEIIRTWEAQNEITPETAGPITIRGAWEKFGTDAAARGLKPATLVKYRQLNRAMLAFAEEQGLRYLREFDVEITRAFRASWTTLHNLTACKRLEYLRAFFRFAQESNWITENPAKKLKPPKVVAPPTMPFSREEMTRILAASSALKTRALVLLMRYSGLRIGDAVGLSVDRIQDGKLLLRTAKTGTLVYVPLPQFVLTALEAVERPNGYFFWTGQSDRTTATGYWRRRLAKVFKTAQVENAFPHRFRDTFATELLLAGVPLERVSILLGHSSTRITEKHYSPWVRDRQAQLEQDVVRTWSTDVLIPTDTKGTRGVQGEKQIVN